MIHLNNWLKTSQERNFKKIGPRVSLTSTVEKRFVNNVVTRTGEPNCVPLTTNLGLKYKQRMLYCPMDFGELILDGLVDTGAISSATSEADLRYLRLVAPVDN